MKTVSAHRVKIVFIPLFLLFFGNIAKGDDEKNYLDVELAKSWQSYSETSQSSALPDAKWWKCFDDETLDSLIEVGLQRNYNVLMATRRIKIARNAVNSARSAYYPNFSLSAGYDNERSSGLLYGSKGDASITSYLSGSVNMSWEIDLFGRVSANVKAQKAALNTSRADRAGVLVSLAAQIASTYFDLRVNQAEIQVANEHSQSQMKALKIAQARFETGLASMLDVDQARTVYYNTISLIPTLENAVHQDINAIAVLLGESPENLMQQLSVAAPLPSHIQLVSTGIPADLLRRRPDVVEAELEIAQQAAQLGIAKKDYLPTLTLDGSIGVAAHRAGDLFKGAAFEYTIAPTLSWTIFDGFERKYNVASARENMQVAIDNYNLTVITAYQETDNALSTYFSDLKYIDILDKLVKSSRDYDLLSIDQYKNGLAPFINVADAQISYLSYQNTLIQARGQALTALVDLYKALGGGWTYNPE